MEYNLSENFHGDEKLLVRIMHRILETVGDNLKTNRSSTTELSDRIRKIIEFEVNKNEN
jgi:hypothetical protein